MEIKLNIYDKTGKNISRTAIGESYDITFGTITELMNLVNINAIEDKMEMLKVIGSSWNELVNVLSGFFPDVTADEWRCVKVKELIPIIVEIAKYAISEMMDVPTDPKNK